MSCGRQAPNCRPDPARASPSAREPGRPPAGIFDGLRQRRRAQPGVLRIDTLLIRDAAEGRRASSSRTAPAAGRAVEGATTDCRATPSPPANQPQSRRTSAGATSVDLGPGRVSVVLRGCRPREVEAPCRPAHEARDHLVEDADNLADSRSGSRSVHPASLRAPCARAVISRASGSLISATGSAPARHRCSVSRNRLPHGSTRKRGPDHLRVALVRPMSIR